LLNNINRPIIFQNRESIFFSSGSLPNFTKGVRFQNGKEIVVYDENVKNFFIPGIKDNRVLNCMIKQIYG